jgi:hypothetical protein
LGSHQGPPTTRFRQPHSDLEVTAHTGISNLIIMLVPDIVRLIVVYTFTVSVFWKQPRNCDVSNFATIPKDANRKARRLPIAPRQPKMALTQRRMAPKEPGLTPGFVCILYDHHVAALRVLTGIEAIVSLVNRINRSRRGKINNSAAREDCENLVLYRRIWFFRYL